MSGSGAERIAELDRYSRELLHLVPDAVKSYGALSKAAQTPGALNHKTKELIALAIGVATRCDGCIAYHARNSVRAGASRQEVAEMLRWPYRWAADRRWFTARMLCASMTSSRRRRR